MKMLNRLFAYGTLQPGQKNHHHVEHIKGDWKWASVRGFLIYLIWGSDYRCPAIILDENEEPIVGQVLTSEILEKNLPQLDHFEGHEYRRVVTQAQLEDGRSIDVYVYVFRQ